MTRTMVFTLICTLLEMYAGAIKPLRWNLGSEVSGILGLGLGEVKTSIRAAGDCFVRFDGRPKDLNTGMTNCSRRREQRPARHYSGELLFLVIYTPPVSRDE